MVQSCKELKELVDVPEEVKQAALDRRLVLFIGSGVSRRMGLPSWGGFAERVLNDLATQNKIDFSELQMLKNLDPRKVLSIARIIDKNRDLDFTQYFKQSSIKETSKVYESLNQIPCTFVTTNYDCLIRPQQMTFDNSTITNKPLRRISQRRDLKSVYLDELGNVIHLHGSIKDQDSMIITTSDYLAHYTNKIVQEFLKDLFRLKTVVFLGYGLDEIELLEHILRHGKADTANIDSSKKLGDTCKESRLFSIQGFYGYEFPTYYRLREYYNESFDLELIGYSKDRNDHRCIDDIMEKWAAEIVARPISLTERIEIMKKVVLE